MAAVETAWLIELYEQEDFDRVQQSGRQCTAYTYLPPIPNAWAPEKIAPSRMIKIHYPFEQLSDITWAVKMISHATHHHIEIDLTG